MAIRPEAMVAAREKRGLSRYALAARSGVTPQVIAKWEKGAGYPSCFVACQVADYLGISLDEYLGHEVKRGGMGIG